MEEENSKSSCCISCKQNSSKTRDIMMNLLMEDLPNHSKYCTKLSSHNRHLKTLLLSFNLSLAISMVGVYATSVHQNQVTNVNEADSAVTDLRLMPDFRSVKLRWTYKNSDELNSSELAEPAAFLISYCELTSWNVETKCREKHMKVKNYNTEDEFVINNRAIDQVHHLVGTSDRYEAQIYELRALTNYTFAVRRSTNQSDGSVKLQQSKTREPSARRLDLDNGSNRFLDRVETKPFRAEATKCLADVSEVVINTGRYFGGRISVENSSDSRCNIMGNKTSEQSSYTLRIDHDICNSKIVDGNRIETMVLVHENKDILAHNTARFLVLCNFLQKSFTLRASISLPKVNGLSSRTKAKAQAQGQSQSQLQSQTQTRQAVVTSLAKRPTIQFEASNGNQTSVPVMLGSMPGVFLASSKAGSNSPAEVEQPAATSNKISEDSNIIDMFAAGSTDRSRNPRLLQQQQHKQQSPRQVQQSEAEDPTTATPRAISSLDNSRVRSLSLLLKERVKGQESDNVRSESPKPVEIHSKVLYVARGDPVSGNQAMATVISANANESLPSVKLHQANGNNSNSIADNIQALNSSMVDLFTNERDPKAIVVNISSMDNLTNSSALHSQVVTLTNNHQVSPGDHHTMATAQQVNEEFLTASSRPRSGRMRYLSSNSSQISAEDPVLGENNHTQSHNWTDYSSSQMGGGGGETKPSQPAHSDQVAVGHSDSSLSKLSSQVVVNSTLAPQQPSLLASNLTSYLMNLSLRALAKVARKSLESFANKQHEHYNTTNESKSIKMNESTNPHVIASTKLQASAATTTNSPDEPHAKIEGQQEVNSTFIDGFMTSKRKVVDRIQFVAKSPDSQLNKTTKEAPQRIETEPRQMNKPPPIYSPMTPDTMINEPQIPNNPNYRTDTQHDQRSTSLLNWFLYSLLVMMGLVCMILALIWLTFSSSSTSRSGCGIISRPRAGILRAPIQSHRNDIYSNISPEPTLLSKSSNDIRPIIAVHPPDIYNVNAAACNNQANNKYGFTGSSKLDAYLSKTSRILGNTIDRQDFSTNASRAASFASENDCNHNELIYTEHVLINSDKLFL